jgi:formyltetrahydrofolate synthetase
MAKRFLPSNLISFRIYSDKNESHVKKTTKYYNKFKGDMQIKNGLKTCFLRFLAVFSSYSADFLFQQGELIAKEVYGADGVEYTPEALGKAKALENDPDARKLGTCMAKTHLSFSHDPHLKSRPKGWTLPVRDIMIYKGAFYLFLCDRRLSAIAFGDSGCSL